MNSNLKWKAGFIAAIILICVIGLIGLPNRPTSIANIKANLASRLKLGLDLQGGTHMILQVQVQEAVVLQGDTSRDQLAQQLRDQQISFEGMERVDDTRFLVKNVGNGAQFKDLVRANYPDWDYALGASQGESYLMSLKPAAEARIKALTLQQAVETIRRRIDQLGLTEPTIAEHGRGDYEILVQLPGEGDPRRAKDIIQAGGQLELKLVRGDNNGPGFSSEAEALASYGGVLPPNTMLVKGKTDYTNATPGQAAQQVWYVLDRTPCVTGRDLRSATHGPHTEIPGRYQVNFTLSQEAAPRFGRCTEENVGKRLAIVLDRTVESAPTINSRISDSGVIQGQFGQEQAKDLALILRAGALPASIRYLEERTVGPSLGADSIRQGVYSSLASLAGVMIFMVWYYRMAGWNAMLALVLNLIILLAMMAYFGGVLTLPGIAGVILTIGMGVDSNVLIFERIREELRAGKANVSAVEAGFDRAWLTIIDTHVTTVVSALFLFAFGTGPVRGFAVTLVIGLLANLFTAVYVSRTIFGWHLARQTRGAELSI
jgi:preprotein translocase subunit SecD